MRQFLAEVPNNVYEISSEKMTDSEEGRARQFVLVAREDQEIVHAVIAKYIRIQKKKRVEKGELNSNTLSNLTKPIHALLVSNRIAMHWRSLYKMHPRSTRTEDRGYAKSELEEMMKISHDITDKVILTIFFSAGFLGVIHVYEVFSRTDK